MTRSISSGIYYQTKFFINTNHMFYKTQLYYSTGVRTVPYMLN